MSDKEAIHNEKLVQSLREWNDEKNRANFYTVLGDAAKAVYFIPVKLLNPDGSDPIDSDGPIDPNAKLVYCTISDQSGIRLLTAFTSVKELTNWQPTVQYTTISFDQYVNAVKSNEAYGGFVINPFSENFLFTKDQLNYFF